MATIIVGIIGALISTYFYAKSIREREPIFMVDPSRTDILSRSNLEQTPIRVYKRDGTPITTDLSALRFYFWNDGKEAIKSENILEPIGIEFDDTTCQILDYKILKVSRSITNFELMPEPMDTVTRLVFQFRILEQDDGMTGQVIFTGNPSAHLHPFGIIEGVKSIDTEPSKLRYLLRGTVKPLLIIVALTLVLRAIKGVKSRIAKIKSGIWKRIATVAVEGLDWLASFAIGFSILAIVSVSIDTVTTSHEGSLRYVPEAIRPLTH